MKFWAAIACPKQPSLPFNYVSPTPNNFVKYNLFYENFVKESGRVLAQSSRVPFYQS